MARKSAFSIKAKNDAILVIEDFELETPKTKSMVEMANNLKLANKKLLLVLPNQNKNVYLSARNLNNVEIITASDLNTYKILDCASLVLTESSIAVINETFKVGGEG